MKKFLLTLKVVLASISFPLMAQNIEPGILQGRVFDSETNEGIPFASVVLEQKGTQKRIGETDESGNYIIKQISSGNYDIKIVCAGYQQVTDKGVLIESDTISVQDAVMKRSAGTLNDIVVVTDKFIRLVEVAKEIMELSKTGKK